MKVFRVFQTDAVGGGLHQMVALRKHATRRMMRAMRCGVHSYFCHSKASIESFQFEM